MIDRLVEMLALERLDRDLFRGHNPTSARHGRLFGGHVAAQALRAAAYTDDSDHFPHSLHGYFLRPGRLELPSTLQVHRIRDGRSFTTRRVVVVQDGEAIFSLAASFHRDEPGGDYQVPQPLGVPAPDEVAARDDGDGGHLSPFDVREVLDETATHGRSTRQIWVRTRGALDDDRTLHASVLTYLSDMGAVGAARRSLRLYHRRGLGASLDHAVWFHRPVRTDQWLLFDMQPVSASGARALVVGTLHDGAGVLGASMAQEVLVRG
jgi:acyl-CoA thioesterase-2